MRRLGAPSRAPLLKSCDVFGSEMKIIFHTQHRKTTSCGGSTRWERPPGPGSDHPPRFGSRQDTQRAPSKKLDPLWQSFGGRSCAWKRRAHLRAFSEVEVSSGLRFLLLLDLCLPKL